MVISDFKNVDLNVLGSKCANLVRFDMPNTPKFICVTESSFLDGFLIELDRNYILDKLNKDKLYAVRSSSNLEDLDKGSFAGMYDTYLNVKHSSLVYIINKCYQSKNNIRVKEYAKELNIDLSDISFSVIIQEMVNSKYSGVINSINPLTNNPDEIVISVVKGLGEALVSGSENSTNYYCSYQYNYKVEGEDILSKSLLRKLIDFTKLCQSKSNRFLDIEFAIDDNKIYFLQARPIAVYKDIDLTLPKVIYDNSNIIESYNNVTLPLTQSFARFIYKEVYTRTFRKAHVNERIIKLNEFALNNMIEVIDSRLYYNLNSWYQLNSLFMSKDNKKSMEAMMGVKSNAMVSTVKFKLSDYINIFYRFMMCLKNLKVDSESFASRFEENYLNETRFDFKEYSIEEIASHYTEIKDNVLDDFTIPVINDTACMFSLNSLKKSLKKYGMDVEGAISSLITNSNEVLSSKGASNLDEIISYVRLNYLSDFKSLSVDEIYEKYYLKRTDETLYNLIDRYITLFGSRVSNELKLETITYSRNEIGFINLIKSYIDNDLDSSYTRKLNEIKVNKKILKKVENTRYYIANREKLRLYRTHVFQIVRNMFDRCGVVLCELGLIEAPIDVYYLEVDEVFKYKDINNLKDLVSQRKLKVAKDATLTYPERIVKYGEARLDIKPRKTANGSNTLKGIGSNKGVIKGKVKIIKDINTYDLSKLNKDVIVFSYATDPGWVRVFPLIGGLIVERGSILSHASVVSREMGLKCVVGVSEALNKLKEDMVVTLNSDTGEVIIDEESK